jgi:hypothetical protein
LARDHGGRPQKVTTDKGTETVILGAFQVQLSYKLIPNISLEEAKKHMHYTKSTHNQKIESLWSRMMTDHNRPVIDNILQHMENGSYDDSDALQK